MRKQPTHRGDEDAHTHRPKRRSETLVISDPSHQPFRSPDDKLQNRHEENRILLSGAASELPGALHGCKFTLLDGGAVHPCQDDNFYQLTRLTEPRVLLCWKVSATPAELGDSSEIRRLNLLLDTQICPPDSQNRRVLINCSANPLIAAIIRVPWEITGRLISAPD